MDFARLSRATSIYKKLIQAKPWPKSALSVPRLQAHRGSVKTGEQENTLGSFRAARRAGAEMCELDVQLSKDRIPVVFHDDNLQRLAGDPVKVCELTAQEIFEKAGAPSLWQVLKDPELTPFFNIELKTEKLLDEALERKVFEVVSHTQSESRVLFSSFNPTSLWRMSLYTSQIPLGLLVGEKMDNKILQQMWLAPITPLHALHLEDKIIDKTGMDFWNAQGVPVAVWTTNDLQKAKQYLEAGALSVISDEILSEEELRNEK